MARSKLGTICVRLLPVCGAWVVARVLWGLGVFGTAQTATGVIAATPEAIRWLAIVALWPWTPVLLVAICVVLFWWIEKRVPWSKWSKHPLELRVIEPLGHPVTLLIINRGTAIERLQSAILRILTQEEGVQAFDRNSKDSPAMPTTLDAGARLEVKFRTSEGGLQFYGIKEVWGELELQDTTILESKRVKLNSLPSTPKRKVLLGPTGKTDIQARVERLIESIVNYATAQKNAVPNTEGCEAGATLPPSSGAPSLAVAPPELVDDCLAIAKERVWWDFEQLGDELERLGTHIVRFNHKRTVRFASNVLDSINRVLQTVTKDITPMIQQRTSESDTSVKKRACEHACSELDMLISSAEGIIGDHCRTGGDESALRSSYEDWQSIAKHALKRHCKTEDEKRFYFGEPAVSANKYDYLDAPLRHICSELSRQSECLRAIEISLREQIMPPS